MTEVRFHGRGGQGAVLAAKTLAKALVIEGKYIKGVPSFGFERRGAPVSAFLRFDTRIIRQTTNIYRPDWVVCIDPTLFRTVDIFEGIRDGGTLVQASARAVDALAIPASVARVGLCDAVRIALDTIGRPITNTVMLGALVRTTGCVALDSVLEALGEVDLRDAALDANRTALRRGHDETRVHTLRGQEVGDAQAVAPHV